MDIFYPLIWASTCVYQGVRNIRFSENSTSFVFLKHLFWDSPFHLITDEFTWKLTSLEAKLKSFLRASRSAQLKGSEKRQHYLVPCKFGFDAFGFISLLTLHSYLLHMNLISILFLISHQMTVVSTLKYYLLFRIFSKLTTDLST